MNWKEKMLLKIEQNCVKSTLDGKVVYLKKSKIPIFGGEWKEIHPPVNEDLSVNWINLIFGGRRNLMRLILLGAIVTMVILQFRENYRILGQAIECCNRCNAINLF